MATIDRFDPANKP